MTMDIKRAHIPAVNVMESQCIGCITVANNMQYTVQSASHAHCTPLAGSPDRARTNINLSHATDKFLTEDTSFNDHLFGTDKSTVSTTYTHTHSSSTHTNSTA